MLKIYKRTTNYALDERAQNMLKSLTKRNNGKLETGLLWQHDNLNLPGSYATPMKRFDCFEKQEDKMIKTMTDNTANYHM